MNALQQLLDETITQIVIWFKGIYLNQAGCPYYAIDGHTGQALDKRDLIPELDDYVPFFWLLGEHDFVQNQIQILKQRLQKKPLLFSRPQIRMFRGIGLPGPWRRWIPHVDSQDYVEILFGLIELHEQSGSIEFLRLAEELFQNILVAFKRQNHLRTWYILPFGPALPVSDALSGMYIEIAADLARLTEDTRYIKLAEQLAKSWLTTTCFQKYGLFPSVLIDQPWRKLPLFKRFLSRVALAKENTSVASGLFTLAASPHRRKWAEQALDSWVTGLSKYFATADMVLAHTPCLAEGEVHGPVLSNNFAVLDILCDLHHLTKSSQCLDLAESIAAYFMKFQARETGLFPDEPGQERSFLDSNTDFAVSLRKLAELTNQSRYREAGERALQGIIRHHRGPAGFFRDVHLKTGAVINDLVETRYVSLLLKALILYRDEYQIYGPEGKWSLFRDR
ncbi:hypothetical protein ACFL27_11430 [candidate division CSSED10-310 bacterium]|uniref:Thioredoxin domain-containing protein n=1 Tax=candidate division CSSED10-310 bacterium TaxID=2855610 RepID=A0ABV6YX81_UNCC1